MVMTQTELAKELGIDRSYLNGILKGKRKPGLDLARRISKATGKSLLKLRPDLKKLFNELIK